MKTTLPIPRPLKTLLRALSPSHHQVSYLERKIKAVAMPMNQANESILRGIQAGNPFSYIRPGGSEAEGLYTFVNSRFHRSPAKRARPYSHFFLRKITPFSGVQYHSTADLDAFCYRYLHACLSADLLGYGSFAPGALPLAATRGSIGLPVTHFENIEPVRTAIRGGIPWSLGLDGLKVLVVHPFKRSIEEQYERRNQISGVRECLPNFTIRVIRPPLTLDRPSGEGHLDRPWNVSFSKLVDAVFREQFDVALIGAGGYGAPLAAEIRSRGKTAIHTAGATQLLFGVIGKRWEVDAEIRTVADSTWIRPIPEDVHDAMKGFDDSGAYH